MSSGPGPEDLAAPLVTGQKTAEAVDVFGILAVRNPASWRHQLISCHARLHPQLFPTAHGWTTSRLASIAASWWSTWPGRNPGRCVCLTLRLEGLQECHFASLVAHFPTMHVQTMNDAMSSVGYSSKSHEIRPHSTPSPSFPDMDLHMTLMSWQPCRQITKGQ